MTQPFNPALFQAAQPQQVQGQAPMAHNYPPVGLPQVAPVGLPQVAPVGYPQAQAPAGYPAPLAQPVPAPLAQSAFAQQLANSAMGAAYVQVLPPGRYEAYVEKFDWVGLDKADPMLFIEVIVETSNNGTPAGFKGKLAPIFFTSKWNSPADAMAKGLAKVGQVVGCPTTADLDARIPDWRQSLYTPNFGKGCKLVITSVDTGKVKDGKPVYNTTAQRVA